MTFFEAAKRILEEADGTPMHYKDITEIALEKGYIESKGLTPDATMGAQLYEHIRRAKAAGRDPEIKQVGKGIFTLVASEKFGLVKEIDAWNKKARKELLVALSEVPPKAFENLIGALLTRIGFENVQVTKVSKDGGVDVIADLTVGGVTNVKTAIQAKRWKHKNNVSSNVVRELRGSLEVDQRGLIITTSEFSKDAREEASAPGKTPISLIDGEKLIDLLVQNELGIVRKDVQYLELALSQLDELEDEEDLAEQRFKSLWPLPGGTEKYVETAKAFLRYISVNEPDIHAIRQWVKKTYPKVTSDGSVKGYLSVLRTLGLIQYDGEAIEITEVGAESLRGDMRKALFAQLESRIVGVKELMESIGPDGITEEEANAFLNEKIGSNWESTHQARYRLLWLMNVGVLRKEGNKYFLVA